MREVVVVVTVVFVLGFVFVPVASADGGEPVPSIDLICEDPVEYPVEVTDATGELVTLEEPPERVVALQASDVQTMYEIDAEDRLVGMPYSDATSMFDRGDRTDVGDGFTVDHEQIIALEPDVVLAGNVTAHEDVEQLRQAGITVYQFDAAESIGDVRENVLMTGLLADSCANAEETVSWMDDRLSIIESAVEDVDPPLAYFEMGEGWTAGSGTFQHEIMETAGLENLAGQVGIEDWGQLSEEVILEEDPEWIVFTDRTDRPDVSSGVEALPAYEEERFVPVDESNASQPAPRIVYEIETIVEVVHPDAYEDAIEAHDDDDSQAGETELDVTEDPETDTDTDTDTDTGPDGDVDDDQAAEPIGDSIPGFGIAVAIVALLVGLGWTMRSQFQNRA